MENLKEKVARVIVDKVRPALAAHRGDIELVDVDADGVVTVRLLGACANCIGAAETMSAIVTSEIKAACPEVTEVVNDDSIDEELILEAFEIARRHREQG